jgi:hypothetical protein
MHNEQTVALCRRYRLWDVMFSEFFFYCGRNSTLQLAAKLKLKDERRDHLFTKMQTHVLRFLEFVATVPNQDNIEECQKILVCFELAMLVVRAIRQANKLCQHIRSDR